MMLPSQRYNREFHEDTFRLYVVFQMYYNGLLFEQDSLDEAVALIKDYFQMHLPQEFQTRGGSLDTITEWGYGHQEVEDYKDEFHRLYIGPGKVIAPPYESYYRNPQGLLMQKETLNVRSFYHSIGLEVEKQGSMPDDHLGLELELICYLLSQWITAKEPKKGEQYYRHYSTFFHQHLSQWIFQHCSLVAQKSTNPICSKMNRFFELFIRLQQEEENQLLGGMKIEQ